MRRIAVLAMTVALAVPALAVGGGSAQASIVTQATAEVGVPVEGATGPSVELVPGTVISIEPSGRGAKAAGRSWILEHVALDERLAETFRVRIDKKLEDAAARTLAPGEHLMLKPAAGAVEIEVALNALEGELASYTVRFLEDGRELSRTPLTVTVGSRAVVGARDGKPAPYLFVILEPVAPGPDTPMRYIAGSGFSQPRVVEGRPPEYPETAREDGIQGPVVLSVVIGEDGSVGKVAVIKSPDERLSAAAEAAVRGWRFEPARNEQGQPIAVEYALAVMFRLD